MSEDKLREETRRDETKREATRREDEGHACKIIYHNILEEEMGREEKRR